MSSKEHANRLARALEGTELARAVNATHVDGRINVLCRVSAGSEGKWAELIRCMLLSTDSEQGYAHSWQAHFCRHYFLKEVEGEKKLVFGWNISIASPQMSDSLDYLIRVVKGEKPNRTAMTNGEIQEMEMSGTAGRNVPKHSGGKGVWTVGGKDSFRPTGAR